MRMYDLIEKKKQGYELDREEILALIKGYVDGSIPDYQMSALLMAICFRGMSDRETFDLTEAMATSGKTVDLDVLGDRSVDKHSTGGVGDKTTLIVAPIVAAAGGVVAKMSGRGLGHTGGTIDKLEAFSGFCTSLSPDAFLKQVQTHGIAVIGQSEELAPADKMLYALRDVTATVDSIPLIASSIMSKKLAAGTRSIVLDVKCGKGAFMKTERDAETLAELMVKIGKAHGRRMSAVISSMDAPLGNAIGNSLELQEAIEVLRGGGPEDLRSVSLLLSALMLEHSCTLSREDAMLRARDALYSGKAYETFCTWIEAQGGDVTLAKDPSLLKPSPIIGEIRADQDGYLASCDAERIGHAAALLGAGRMKKEDAIDYGAGIILSKKPSDAIKKDDVIATLYTSKKDRLQAAMDSLQGVFPISKKPVELPDAVHRVIQ